MTKRNPEYTDWWQQERARRRAARVNNPGDPPPSWSGEGGKVERMEDGEWKGYTRYRHCLYEIVEGVTYKRNRWANTHAELAPIVHAYAQKHTTRGAA